jgi:hypothetical protein
MTDLVDTEDIEILYYTPASTVEETDQVVIEDDYIEVKSVEDTDDIDEVVIVGYSHVSGDTVRLSLYADDLVGIWTV